MTDMVDAQRVAVACILAVAVHRNACPLGV